MSIEAIVDRLHARKSGGGWIARCPAHEDKNPSLSIAEREGKILLRCHAGCTVEAICAALEIEVGDLFSRRNGNLSSGARPNVIAEYFYTDETDSLLFVVERREPKDFRQRKPDGRGGWIWSLNGVRRVLYRLPEVLAASSVIVCEGEKDVETARSLGLVATCNPGGAGKWRNEYSEFLRGKRIAIIADADDPGRRHAQQIAMAFVGKMTSLKVFELPGSKDLSDWVAGGGTRDALEGFIAIQPEWEPTEKLEAAAYDSGGQVVSVSLVTVRASEVAPEAIDWLYEDRIEFKGLALFCGPPDVGKGAVTIDLVARATTGTDWPDRKNPHLPMDVAMLVSEDGLATTLVPRLMVAGADLNRVHFAKQTIVTFKDKKQTRKIALDSDLSAVEIMLREHPAIRIIVIDPLGSYLGKLKKNSDDHVRPLLDSLKELAERTGIAIISVSHFNKNFLQSAIDRTSGAGAIAQVPRAAWSFVRDDDDDTGESRLMLSVKLNNVKESKKSGLRYRLNEELLSIAGKPVGMPKVEWLGASSRKIDNVLQAAADPERRKLPECISWLERYLESGAKMSRDVYAQKFSEATVRRAAANLGVESFKTRVGWMMRLPEEQDAQGARGETA